MRLALAVLVGCGRVAFDPVGDAGTGIDDIDGGDAGRPTTWGEYAATLNVPECTGPELLVNDTTSDLDGGTAVTTLAETGPTLSLFEALHLANNRAGRDVIRFDPSVFPVDTPGVIAVVPAVLLPLSLPDICIDGRNRGVIVDWSACPATTCLPFTLVDGSLMIGLTLLDADYELVVRSSQLAGCRVGTNGTDLRQRVRPWTIELVGGGGLPATLGPGNAIGAMQYAIRLFGGDADMRIHDNFIGFDPITRAVIPVVTAFDVRDGFGLGNERVVIETNVIATTGNANELFSPINYPITFLRNHLGVDETGARLAGGPYGGIRIVNSTWNVDDNRFENVGIAILLDNGFAMIKRNLITGSTAGIEYTSVPPVAPPAIDIATPTMVAGPCGGGTIEVFADPGNLAAQFLGETPCTTGRFSLAGTFPVGLNATATQTNNASTSELSAPLPIQ